MLAISKLVSRVSMVLFLVLILCSTGCRKVDDAIVRVDDAIGALNRGVDSFDDLNQILGGLKTNLDDGLYKGQVNDIIENAGGVAQTNAQGTIDFVRSRAVEDLLRLKSTLMGNEPPKRQPVLSTTQNREIRFNDPARTTITVIGWNLDVAEKERKNYLVKIKNPKSGPREVSRDHVSYLGQYAIQVNLSSSGAQLKHYDSQLVFSGFDPKFQL